MSAGDKSLAPGERSSQPAQVQAAEDEMAISAAMSEGNKHGVKSFVAAKIVAAYLASRTPAPGMAGGMVPPDCVAEWPELVRTLYLTARTSSVTQCIPSHALDAMRAILLAAPHPAPAQQAAGAEPDMFWDSEDGETFGHSIEEVTDCLSEGEEMVLDCARRLPQIRVRALAGGDYQIIDAIGAAGRAGS